MFYHCLWRMYGVTLAAGALLFLALSATRLSAGGYNPSAPAFIDLYQAFNDNYKQALLATHQRDKEKAWSELAGARVAWQMLVRQHYDAPPPEYRKDQLWKRDLTTIGSDISTAVTQAQAGDLAGVMVPGQDQAVERAVLRLVVHHLPDQHDHDAGR